MAPSPALIAASRRPFKSERAAEPDSRGGAGPRHWATTATRRDIVHHCIMHALGAAPRPAPAR